MYTRYTCTYTIYTPNHTSKYPKYTLHAPYMHPTCTTICTTTYTTTLSGTLKYPYQMGGGCTGNEDEDQYRSDSKKYCRPQAFPDIVEDRDCVCTIQNPPTGDAFIATQFEACTLPDEHPFAMNPDTGRQNENPLTANPILGMGSNLIKITFNEVPTCVENATCDFPLMRAAWDTDPRQTVGDDTGEASPTNYVQEFRKGRQPYWVVWRTMDTVQTHDFTSATYVNRFIYDVNRFICEGMDTVQTHDFTSATYVDEIQ